MTLGACLVVAAICAVTDWWAVAGDRRKVEYLAKPAVLVALIGGAIAITPADPTIRVLFVVGLCFGLLGDVALMLGHFIPGAAAFLLGHIAYIAGFSMAALHVNWMMFGGLLFAAVAVVVGIPVVAAARKKSRVLGLVVMAYMVALGGVLILGIGTAVPVAVAGVVLFSASDALLSYGKFVGPTPGGRVLVHVTYHGAQALLVGSLLTLH